MNVPAVCAISQVNIFCLLLPLIKISIHAANHALYDLGREVVGARQVIFCKCIDIKVSVRQNSAKILTGLRNLQSWKRLENKKTGIRFEAVTPFG